MINNQAQIARLTNYSSMFVSNVKRNLRKTTDRFLAIEVSKLSGLAPIEHISPRVREAYARAYPELLQPPLQSPSAGEKEEE